MPISLRLAALSLALTTTACAGMASFTAGGRSSAGGGSAPASSGDTYASNGARGGGGGGASSGPSAGAVKPGVPVTKFSDFAFEVKDSTGDYNRAWVIDKLTTFNVSSACMEKMIDKKNSALHSASFYTRDIVELAKTLTGDDWSDIETQHNNDRENNKKLVEPMIDAFKQNYSLSITIDGDDCDVRHGSLWLRYWTTIGQTVRENPPASGKVFIQLAVRGDARDIKVEVDEQTSTYVITAPRDIEKTGWNEKLEKPFRKHARQK